MFLYFSFACCFCDPGIVRGIDTFKRLLYVLTPVPQSTLEKVDLLLQGFVQIPTCLLQVSGPLPTAASVSMKFIYFSDNHQ